MKRLVSIFLVASFSSSVFADLDGVNVQLKADDPLVVSEGIRVYAEECAACHGANLEGQKDWKRPDEDGLMPAPPHDDTGHTWHHTDDLLFEITKFGIQKLLDDDSYETTMPTYEESLTDDEIIAVLSYIKSTWSEDKNDWHNQVNETANKYWEPSKNPLVSEAEIKGEK